MLFIMDNAFTAENYLKIKQAIRERGYTSEIEWADGIRPCERPVDFWSEYSWVVLNSGMKNQVARKIWDKIIDAYIHGKKAADVFGHQAKAQAIDTMFREKEEKLSEYIKAENKLDFLKSLPWIGDITKYHLAKNLGFDCCKPDRHLVRISKALNTTPEELCKRLSDETGDRIATVDLVIWRAANLGLL